MKFLQKCFVVYGYKEGCKKQLGTAVLITMKKFTSVIKLLAFEILLNILTNPFKRTIMVV